MNEGHPTDGELKDYARFRLTISEAKALDAHLRACPACNARYQSYADTGSPAAPPTVNLSDPNVPG